LRAWGSERIAEALRARGVEEGLIEAALADEPGEAAVGRAVEVLAGSGSEVADEASRARALALLARRGYPLEVAYDAVRAFERKG
jgi:SOS response regulatory protein OraA/RecX